MKDGSYLHIVVGLFMDNRAHLWSELNVYCLASVVIDFQYMISVSSLRFKWASLIQRYRWAWFKLKAAIVM